MDNQMPLFNRRNIINLLFLGILVLGLPVGIQLVQSQKILRSFAAQESIKFLTDGVNVIDRGGRQVAISSTVTLEITSKDGLPNSQASLPTSLALNYSPVDIAYAAQTADEGGGSCGVDPVDEQCYCGGAVAEWCNCEGNCKADYATPDDTPYAYPTPTTSDQAPSYTYPTPSYSTPPYEYPTPAPEEKTDQGAPAACGLIDHFAGCNTDTLEECDVYKDSCTGTWPVYKNCNKTPGKCGIPEVNASLAAAAEVDKDAECRDKPPEYYCDNANFDPPKCIEKKGGSLDGADCTSIYSEVKIAYCPGTPCDDGRPIHPPPKLLSQAETAATKNTEASRSKSGGECTNGVKAGETACDKQGDTKQRKCQPGSTPDNPIWADEVCAAGGTCQGRACSGGTQKGASPTPTARPTQDEKCYVCDQSKWRLSGGTGSCPANITRTCQTGKDVNQVCKSAQDLKDVNCISTRPYTLSFRVAENPSDLASAPSVDYTLEPMRVNYTFQDPKPGKKFIYVQFNLSDGKKVSATPVSINLAQSTAQVASLTCSLDPTGQGIKITFRGENFGSKEGRINVDNSIPLRILSWGETQVVALSDDTSIRGKQDLLGVILTRNDGEKITEKCGIGISLISLGAKLFCRAPSQHSQDNVEVIIKQDSPGAKKIKEIGRIDKEGVLLGLKSKLEENKFYSVSIKAPKSLRRVIAFTALDGTITIPQTILPVGDIYPRDGGDGKINSLDAAELRRQWGKVSTASKNCDFNQDGVCNSFEWACMRYDFNKEDDTAL